MIIEWEKHWIILFIQRKEAAQMKGRRHLELYEKVDLHERLHIN